MRPTYQARRKWTSRLRVDVAIAALTTGALAAALALAAFLPAGAEAGTSGRRTGSDAHRHPTHHAPRASRRSSAGATLVIEGAGFGHGVGMSQWGALGYAEHGYSAAEILAHYYTGTAIGHVSPRQIVKVLVGRQVKRVPLEAYVRGVVAAEMPSSWPAAALEAQAIASRTYALTADAGGKRFDVYADARSQVYLGRAAQTPSSNAAVKATEGEVVTYEGKPVITYFFSSSGGETEDVQNVFEGASPQPWLVGVPDPYEQSPMRSWTMTMGFSEAARRLKGLLDGAFEGIEVLRRGWSPRIVSAYVLGSAGNTEVSGAQLASRLGLYSTWAHFSVMSGGKLREEPDLSGRPAGARGEDEGTQPAGTQPAGAESTAPGPGSSGPLVEAPTADGSEQGRAVDEPSGGMRAP